jgi:hypothetical protein
MTYDTRDIRPEDAWLTDPTTGRVYGFQPKGVGTPTIIGDAQWTADLAAEIAAIGVVTATTDPITGGIVIPIGADTQAADGVTSFTVDDTGTSWVLAPTVLAFSATLTAGTTTTVLLEVQNAVGTVTTAATVTADTISQTLRQSFQTRDSKYFRFRRSSGSGSVTITF